MLSLSAASRQAIIGNYAVPILEERQVWGTTDNTRTAYLDSQVLCSHRDDLGLISLPYSSALLQHLHMG